MTRRVTNTERELSCCQLGYGTESLVFLAKVLWFNPDRDLLLPSSLVSRFAIVDTTLRAISEAAPNDPVKKSAGKFLEAVTLANADLEVRWQSEERYKLLDFLEDVDEECIPEEWFETNSLLSQQCWKNVLKARASLANALPKKLGLCLRTGELVARVERLVRDAEDGSTPGERYPIQALELTLVKLRESHACLNGLDTSLSIACGVAGADLEDSQRRVREVYDEVIRRFAKPKRQRRLSSEEANVATAEYLRKHPNATQREIAEAIACSHGLVGKTLAWQAVQTVRRANHQPKTKRATNLADRELDETGREDAELQRLIAEHESDYEKSPFEEGNAPIVHKRV